jgi:hypothetical protein
MVEEIQNDKDQCVEAFMDRLLDWRDKAKAEKWHLQWFDGSLLEAKGRQRKELRRRTSLRPEHLDKMIAALDAYPDDSRIVPDELPAFCANIVSGHENAEALAQELRELTAMSFLLTFWVKTPHYEVKALRDVVLYERYLLTQREQV